MQLYIANPRGAHSYPTNVCEYTRAKPYKCWPYFKCHSHSSTIFFHIAYTMFIHKQTAASYRNH